MGPEAGPAVCDVIGEESATIPLLLLVAADVLDRTRRSCRVMACRNEASLSWHTTGPEARQVLVWWCWGMTRAPLRDRTG